LNGVIALDSGSNQTYSNPGESFTVWTVFDAPEKNYEVTHRMVGAKTDKPTQIRLF